MPKFRVHLTATASTGVVVEAPDEEAAIEAVWDAPLPYADAFCGFEISEWELPSEARPEFNKPEDDCEEIES